MNRIISLACTSLLFSTLSFAQTKGGPDALPASPEDSTSSDVKDVPAKRQIKASVHAKTLELGSPERTKIATFEAKATGQITAACKLLKDKKLDCMIGNKETNFGVNIRRAPGKDTLILEYPAEHHLLIGSKSLTLVFPGVDGIWPQK